MTDEEINKRLNEILSAINETVGYAKSDLMRLIKDIKEK